MSIARKIGAAGEQTAVDWLTGQGFDVVARNWRDGRYELDIVAQRLDTLHFVEVKTRNAFSWGSPEDALDAAKQRAFKRAVQAYLTANPTHLEPQMDLIAVDKAGDQYEVRYIPEAVISRW